MFTFLQYFSVYELFSYKIVVLEELILTEIWELLVFKVNIFQALVLNSLMCEFLKIDLGVWDSLLSMTFGGVFGQLNFNEFCIQEHLV